MMNFVNLLGFVPRYDAFDVSGLLQDLRYALRTLRRRRSAAAVVLLTLALGIGATTAIFSFVDAILLTPLPYPHADRIVGIWERPPVGQPGAMSTLNYLDYAQSTIFEHVAATAVCCGATILGGTDTPIPIAALKVSPQYFDVFGARAALGRTFAAGEEMPGHDHVVVLTHHLWESRFGADPALVGRTIQLNDQPYTVIGVMPAGAPFDHMFCDAWLPLSFDGRMTRKFHWLLWTTGGAIGLLKPGISLDEARAQLNTIAARLSKEYPASNRGWGVVVRPYASIVVDPGLRRSLFLLLAAVGLVLLIACVNVANVVLGWALAREHEVIVRTALGVSPVRLGRQFLTEAAAIAALGGALSIPVAYGAMDWLRTTLTDLPLGFATASVVMPPEASVRLNWQVLVFAMVVTSACAVLCGLAPALGALRTSRSGRIAVGHRASTPLVHHHIRAALIVAEVALAFVLLASSGLLMRSVMTMRRADLGFSATRVVGAAIATPSNRFANADQLRAYMRMILGRVRALPGVVDAAFVDALPMRGWVVGAFVQNASRPVVERAERPVTGLKVVGPTYFHVLGSRLLRGRVLDERDREGAPLVAVINETMARQFFPTGNPVGQRLLTDAPRFGFAATESPAAYEVVGVIADERLLPFDDREPHPVMYVSNEQDPHGFGGIIVRTSASPTQLEAALRSTFAAVDKDDAITQISTIEQLESESMVADRLRTAILVLFAAVALALSAIGIFGVMSHSVVQRTPEIGIRAALGASSRELVRLVLRSGMGLAAIGLLIGGIAGFGVVHFVRSFLYGVGPFDPVAWAAAIVILAAVAFVSSYLPARAAARVDPIEALRAE